MEIEGSITLTQPPLLELSLSGFEYPNGYNISIFGNYNGSITTTAGGGITPYTFSWSEGSTTQKRSNIGFGNYLVEITDANGCLLSSDITFTQPAREGWALTGNTGIDTTIQFIGTTDSNDVVFKSNGAERLRITGDGTLKFTGNLQLVKGGSDSIRVPYIDQQGMLKIGPGDPDINPCVGLTSRWFTDYCNHSQEISVARSS